MKHLTTIVLTVSLIGCVYSATPADQAIAHLDNPPRVVGLWVTRWDFSKPHHIRQVMADAKSAGVTDVYFQVRGQGDALYRSRLEPWSELLLEPGQTDPGFDPLAIAVESAHQHGMRLHAWVNVMALWKGKTPPVDARHPYHARPDWRLYDTAGRPQPLNDHYVCFNPLSDGARHHILSVIGDIATRYPVDGIHLDYIRFISEKADAASGYPADRASHARFTRDTGKNAEAEPDAYRRYIAERITSLVEMIGRRVEAVRPEAKLSAAVWRNPSIAKEKYQQDYTTWLRRDLLDAAMPMVYTTDDGQYASDLKSVLAIETRTDIYAGVGIYKHERPTQCVAQITRAHALGVDGVTLFAYGSLFESANPLQDKSPEARALRRMRLNIIRAPPQPLAGC